MSYVQNLGYVRKLNEYLVLLCSPLSKITFTQKALIKDKYVPYYRGCLRNL